jgi:hypothetical protein
VGVDSLEQAKRYPDIDSEDVEILSDETVKQWSRDRSGPQDENLCGVCVLCC